MNKNFYEYTRSCAFQISLSIRQIEALQWVLSITNVSVRERDFHPCTVGTLQSLERKGLCYWDRKGGIVHGPYITSAGELMCKLLSEAGYTRNENILPRAKVAS